MRAVGLGWVKCTCQVISRKRGRMRRGKTRIRPSPGYHRYESKSDPEQPSIFLLDASDQDVLFKLQAEIDESLLAVSHSRPARGYRKLDLERFFIPQGKHVAVEEMMQLAATFAALISRNIAVVPVDTSEEVTASAHTC